MKFKKKETYYCRENFLNVVDLNPYNNNYGLTACNLKNEYFTLDLKHTTVFCLLRHI